MRKTQSAQRDYYNAIGVGYMPWQTDVDKCALPVGRAFYLVWRIKFHMYYL